MSVSTRDIVNGYAAAFKDLGVDNLYGGDFSAWLKRMKEIEPYVANKLTENIRSFLPLRDEVYKLIVKALFEVMPFSKEYIVNNYQRIYKEKSYLIYPANKPSRMLVLFSGYINYISYNRFSWYFDEFEKWEGDTLYLFLNDPSLHWYVGESGKPEAAIYEEIIKKTAADYGIERNSIYAVGASMGGYAALYFSFSMGLAGCIAVHAQLSKKSAARYGIDNWYRKINDCGHQFIDVDDLIARSVHSPMVYLEAGRHPSDDFNLDRVVTELSKKNCVFAVERVSSLDHSTKSPSKEKIESIFSFFESVKKSSNYE